jgi:hypothetical protein
MRVGIVAKCRIPWIEIDRRFLGHGSSPRPFDRHWLSLALPIISFLTDADPIRGEGRRSCAPITQLPFSLGDCYRTNFTDTIERARTSRYITNLLARHEN